MKNIFYSILKFILKKHYLIDVLKNEITRINSINLNQSRLGLHYKKISKTEYYATIIVSTIVPKVTAINYEFMLKNNYSYSKQNLRDYLEIILLTICEQNNLRYM